MEAVAIIMFHAEDDEVMRWIFDEIEKGGKNMEVQEWLGRTIKEDGVEMSGMVWLFCQWAERDGEALAEVPSSWTDS
jgi:hypothetical protein